MKNRYIAITISPIYKTMGMTSTPCGLWTASYIFSYFAKTLCEKIAGKVGNESIISPYFDGTKTLRDGVGLYHDRIIFKAGPVNIEEMNNIIDSAKAKISEVFFPGDYDAQFFLTGYLQASAISFDAEDGNCILASGEMLSAFELEQMFNPVETENHILSFFDARASLVDGNEAKTKNENIKIWAKEHLDEWQLWHAGKNRIKDLKSIASGGVSLDKQLKKHQYYAVIQSDGDNMGTLIEKLNSDEDIRKLSKTCLDFAEEAARAIHSYGGVTIYAGGDDLLLLAPVENEKGQNIFHLTTDLEDLFSGKFHDYSATPTLSFGIFICYYKFPLYEAFDSAYKLLFYRAKKTANKNSIAVNFQKHSGRSFGLLIEKTADDGWRIKLKDLISLAITGMKKNTGELLSSVPIKLKTFEALFSKALEDDLLLENAFNNIFDHPVHVTKDGKLLSYISLVKDYLSSIIKGICRVKALEVSEKDGTPQLTAIDSVTRIVKFFIEKKGEE